MTTLVTPDEMFAAESRVIETGVPASVLMRRAADSIATWIDLAYHRSRNQRPFAIALVGPGNNGGDALVTLACLIERGWRCAAVLLHREQLGDLPATQASLGQIALVTPDDLGQADIILDGIFGFRGRPTLPADVVDMIGRAVVERAKRRVPLIAIDVPTGIDSGTGQADAAAFRSDVTLCLGLPKIGLIREPAASCVGELILLDIGIPSPPDAAAPKLLTANDVRPLLPHRRASAHKHTTGAVVVVGGAATYYGAPRLSAEAALRAGAGLVAAAAPSSMVSVIASQVPEVVLVPLDDSDGAAASEQVQAFVTARSATLTAAIVGPGLSRSARATDLLDRLLGDLTNDSEANPSIASLPLVIDADGLNWLSDQSSWPRRIQPGSAVLTPHAGELARLLKWDVADVLKDPIVSAVEAARRFKQVVVLKTGYAPVVSPTGDIWISPRATPELATAGTGDVLAGIIGGLLAQGLTPFDAARAGIYIGGMAGRAARGELGTIAVIARDVIARVPNAIRQLQEPDWGV